MLLTNHVMELMTIGRYAQIYLDSNYRKQNIAIFSNSQAAMSLNSNIIRTKSVWEYPERLNNIGQEHRLPMCKTQPIKKNSNTERGSSEHPSAKVFLVSKMSRFFLRKDHARTNQKQTMCAYRICDNGDESPEYLTPN